jgi:hypothetical protein
VALPLLPDADLIDERFCEDGRDLCRVPPRTIRPAIASSFGSRPAATSVCIELESCALKLLGLTGQAVSQSLAAPLMRDADSFGGVASFARDARGLFKVEAPGFEPLYTEYEPRGASGASCGSCSSPRTSMSRTSVDSGGARGRRLLR